MALFPQTLRTTAADVLSTVSATSGTITTAVTSLNHLAEVGALNAKAYRDDTERKIKLRQENEAETALILREEHRADLLDRYETVLKRIEATDRKEQLYRKLFADKAD